MLTYIKTVNGFKIHALTYLNAPDPNRIVGFEVNKICKNPKDSWGWSTCTLELAEKLANIGDYIETRKQLL